MILCPAQPFDIPAIMQIERGAFIPPLQEKQKTFEDRLRVFPQGFFVLSDSDVETVMKAGRAVLAGYVCAERWRDVPADDKPFKINHRASKSHVRDGAVLYVSSFALHPEYQGRGLARAFFLSSLAAWCGAFPQVRTVLLLASTEWRAALRVYESAGFTEVRRIPAFFPSLHEKTGCDGIVLTCSADTFRREGILRHNGNGSVVIGAER